MNPEHDEGHRESEAYRSNMTGRDELDFQSLRPEAIGTKAGPLIAPCHSYRRGDRPPRPDAGFPVAVALSGGGFRASLAAVGVLRFLADIGLLTRVRYASSVSGGSIANALLAHRYEELDRGGFGSEVFEREIQRPLFKRVSSDSLSRTLLRQSWKILGSPTRTTLLADGLDEWFFGGMKLHELPGPCRFIFNCANLSTGVRFGFERQFSGDYVLGTVPSAELGIRLADAVAASAAVPGFFAAFVPSVTFPCHAEMPPTLVDGGAYENTALEPVDRLRDTFLVALNAGGIFRIGGFGSIPVVRDLQRANALLYRQSTGLRMRDMVRRFKLREGAEPGQPQPEGSAWGVLFGLASTFKADHWPPCPYPPEERVRLASLRTSFDQFSAADCERLMHLSWWLTGAAIATYHPDVMPRSIPEWVF